MAASASGSLYRIVLRESDGRLERPGSLSIDFHSNSNVACRGNVVASEFDEFASLGEDL